jgi:hypothetical protein
MPPNLLTTRRAAYPGPPPPPSYVKPRVIILSRLNAWIAQVDRQAAKLHQPVDLADLYWIGAYERGLSPRQAIAARYPACAQLDLFAPPSSLRDLPPGHLHH